jgi:hypothetical protein
MAITIADQRKSLIPTLNPHLLSGGDALAHAALFEEAEKDNALIPCHVTKLGLSVE